MAERLGDREDKAVKLYGDVTPRGPALAVGQRRHVVGRPSGSRSELGAWRWAARDLLGLIVGHVLADLFL